MENSIFIDSIPSKISISLEFALFHLFTIRPALQLSQVLLEEYLELRNSRIPQ